MFSSNGGLLSRTSVSPSNTVLVRNMTTTVIRVSRGKRPQWTSCRKMPTRNILSVRHVTRTDDGFLKLEPPTLLEDVITLSFGTGLPKTNSEEFDCWLFSLWSGLAQILMRPSRQMVRIDSLVNTRPERGSACTRWATSGDSFGTSRILGEGWRTPVGGQALSQCADGLPPLNVGEALEGWRSGTTISSSARSHRSSWVSYKYVTMEIYSRNRSCHKQNANWQYLSMC